MRTRTVPRMPRCAGFALVVVALVASVLFVVPARTAGAAATVPFASRKAFNDNGAIAIFGNNLLTCNSAVAGCTAARQGQGSSQNNNNYDMVNLDVDTDATTASNPSPSP
jgi:hypothetical protein